MLQCSVLAMDTGTYFAERRNISQDAKVFDRCPGHFKFQLQQPLEMARKDLAVTAQS